MRQPVYLIIGLVLALLVGCNQAPVSTSTETGAQLWFPDSDSELGPIYSLVARRDDSVWAVGATKDSPTKAILLHWGGSVWKSVATLGDDLYSYWLHDLVVLSDSDVWAVGNRSLSRSGPG